MDKRPPSRARQLLAAAVAIVALADAGRASPEPPTGASAARFLDIYRDLIDTDTTNASGSCTVAAQKMASRLLDAGLAQSRVELFAVAEHPRDGGLLVTLPGTDSRYKGLLLVAHLDVAGVRPDAWARDPFKLVEDGGYFYGRGVSDDKAMAAVLIDSAIRLREDRVKLLRTVKIALTCGEETATAFNGAEFLAHERRSSIDADIAIVPSGGGRLDDKGAPVSLSIQAGEKTQQNFQVVVTAAGGHSSRPAPHGAVERLARTLVRLSEYEFPPELSDVTRRYFRLVAANATPALRASIDALLADPGDAAAARAIAAADTGWNSMLRTTCAATRVEAGEGLNTLPQRATATINCRILPGHGAAEVRDTLVRITDDPSVTIQWFGVPSPPSLSPPLSGNMIAAIARAANTVWPGIAIVPTLLTGATDARHFNAVGIPAYGVTAVLNDPDGNGVHAANERIRVSSVYAGRDFIYALIRRYGTRPDGTLP